MAGANERGGSVDEALGDEDDTEVVVRNWVMAHTAATLRCRGVGAAPDA